MMVWYIIKMLILLPMIGLLAWGSLRLAKRMQDRMAGASNSPSAARIVATMMLSPTQRLIVIEFHGAEILVASSRAGLVRLAEAPRGSVMSAAS